MKVHVAAYYVGKLIGDIKSYVHSTSGDSLSCSCTEMICGILCSCISTSHHYVFGCGPLMNVVT